MKFVVVSVRQLLVTLNLVTSNLLVYTSKWLLVSSDLEYINLLTSNLKNGY